MFEIQLLNNIAEIGLKEFNLKKYHLNHESENPDAILVRSQDMHEMHFPSSLKVVGRAGAGTNNIPIEKLTALGIPVLNTPGANANAVKELVITGMLLACRNICSAWDYSRQLQGDDEAIHQKVEHDKKQFAGFELPGKTLGVIGLGNIGVRVCNAARHLEMKVIGYDPAMTIKNAWDLRSSVKKAETIEETILNADFISLHIPLNEHTHHLIDAKRLKLMKRGAILLNFSRDGIVDNHALEAALADGHIRTYVCDFPNALFLNNPNVISLPHLGASTQEAEENCAVMIAEQVQDFLENGHIHHSVNFPAVKMPRAENSYRIAIVNANVPNMVAQISTILSKKNINIINMINKSRGDVAYTLLDINNDISTDTLNQLKQIEGIICARKL